VPKIALVTGANQGLGYALVKGLSARLGPTDTVYLTARDPDKGMATLQALDGVTSNIAFERLDVIDATNVAAVAQTIERRHGGIDILISNAAARIAAGVPPADQVRPFVETNNHGTTRMLRRFLPILKPGARFVVVASSFGRLTHLPAHLHHHFDVATASLADIDTVMDRYVAAVVAGTAADEGWPDWINVPSKIAQVAAAKIAARDVARDRPDAGILINAACPGLIDTEASRPWFDDMSNAQSPDDAAQDVLWLALLPAGATEPHGELVQFRKALSWT